MKVHELIDKPEKWLKGSLVATKDNRLTTPTSPNAYSFCIRGAFMKICGTNSFYSPSFKEEEKKIIKKLGFQDENQLVDWNNSPDLTFEQFHAKLVEKDI